MEYYSTIKGNELLIQAPTWGKSHYKALESQKHTEWKKLEEFIPYDPVSVECSNRQNSPGAKKGG